MASAFGFLAASALGFLTLTSSLAALTDLSAPSSFSSFSSGYSPAASYAFLSEAALAFFTGVESPSPLVLFIYFLPSPALASFLAGFPSNYSLRASYSFCLSASSLAHLSLLEATETLASTSLSMESMMLSSYLQSFGS